MSHLILKDLDKTYWGQKISVVNNLNIEIQKGELVALVGPSGCGKSTTLRMIAGLETPTNGDILFNQESVVALPPEKRNVSMVFQKPLLFPNMNIQENVAFGLKMRKVNKTQRLSQASEMLAKVKLKGYDFRRSDELSGGQEQRVSLARGLAVEPQIFLLDEPLSALDVELRIEMRDLIRDIQKEMEITTVFVTHDQEEAVMLADRIALMFDGEIVQFDKPSKFYEQPKTKRVAEFFGAENFIEATQIDQKIMSVLGEYHCPQLESQQRNAWLVIRPENIVESDDDDALEGEVFHKSFRGTYIQYKVKIFDSSLVLFTDPSSHYDVGDSLRFKLKVDKLWALHREE